MAKEAYVKITETEVIDLYTKARRVSCLVSDIRDAFDPDDYEKAKIGLAIEYERLQTYALLADEIAQSLQDEMNRFSGLVGGQEPAEKEKN